MRTPPDLTNPDDLEVVDALSRQCSACEVPKGTVCLCTIHRPQHTLALCPTAAARIVHHMRSQTPKRKGQ